MKTLVKTFVVFFTIILTSGTTLSAQGDWTIMQSFDIPGKASGLAYDGTYLYFGIYGANGDRFYRFDPQTGESTLIFNHPVVDDSFGMTWDGEYLWVIYQPTGSSNPALATQIDLSGNTVSTFPLPDHYMSGIAWDDGNFFACTYYPNPGVVYNTDDEGTVLSQFVPPVYEQIWDVAVQDDFLWFVDYNADMIYKTDRDGLLIEEHPTENMKPSGIVWDGNYIWYVDGQLSSPSKLYKVDPGGAGAPIIDVPVTSWDFGIVAVGDSAVWNIEIGNIGTADLIIENLSFPGAVPLFSWEAFPQTIAPGENTQLELIFKPVAYDELNTFVNILSNDPLDPEVELTVTGNGVNAGPSFFTGSSSYVFADVRVGGFERLDMIIKNIGSENLVIESAVASQEVWFTDPDIEFPLTIFPLQSVDVGLWFNPSEGIEYNGTMTINCNDPENPANEISISATGLLKDWEMGDEFWWYLIDVGFDNSPKAMGSLKDITGDGVNEVIVASEDNFIRCFNGNSHHWGILQWEFEIYSGNVYQSEALDFLPDIDDDGFDEVVVGTTGGDRSVVVISGKTGQQIWKFQTNMWGDGGWVYEVDASTDFNYDGIPDVLACAGNDAMGTGPNRTFCLDGKDGSLMWAYYMGGPGYSVIAIDDVTGDGVPDVLAGGSYPGEQQGKVVCIDGSTGFEIWTVATEGTSVWALLQIDDINADGVADVVAGEFGSGKFQAFDATNGDILYDGFVGGGFSIITHLIKLDDVNGDGFHDFTLTSNNSNCIVIDGITGETIWFTSLLDQAQKVARIPDISGDGINDVIVGTLFQSNYVYYLDGVNGEILYSQNFDEPVDALTTIPDINGDGSWEVVVGGREGKVVCLSGGTDAVTSIPESNSVNQVVSIEISPNPAKANTPVSIRLSGEMNGNLHITTAGGVLVKDFGFIRLDDKSATLNWKGRNMDGSALSKGLYFIVFSNDQTVRTSKLVIH